MNVLRPHSFDAALVMKAECPDAVPVAGGTDLWVDWPVKLEGRQRTYLDLSGLEELRHVTTGGDSIVLGAGATFWDVLCDATCAAELPSLLDAARQVGTIQIQARGTWAGNIANGSPAADGVTVLMAHDAEVELASVRGSRRIVLDAYYTGYRESVAEHDELIRAIHVPRRPLALSRFEKVGSRRAQTIAKVGVAITRSDAGWRVVAMSMAPTVRRCPSVERWLASGRTGDLGTAVDADLSPIDDLRSTAAYRRQVFVNLLEEGSGTQSSESASR